MFLYNISIKIYGLFLFIAAIFNSRAKQLIQGRNRQIDSLEGKSIWIHCASHGEFEQGIPLIKSLQEKYQEFNIVITFYSPSGYNYVVNNYNFSNVYYLPLDTKRNAIKLIKKFKPVSAFFIKYEIWPNILHQLHKQKIPTYLISAHFRKEQVYFNYLKSFWADTFRCFTFIFTQLEQQKLLKKLKIKNNITCGDTRYDRVLEISKNQKKINKIIEFKKNTNLLVAGSTWEKDEILLKKLQEDNCQLKLVIAPHNVNSDNIYRIKSLFKNSCLYSEFKSNCNVLIIDKLGLLSYIYKYANICYIGGGFNAGIHNCLEAAVYNKPIIFGPKYKNFNEASELINLKLAISISNYNSLKNCLQTKSNNYKFANDFEITSKKYFKKKAGATNRILNIIKI